MDEMTGALVGLAAIAGAAIGKWHGASETNRVLVNEREYLRGHIARVAGEPYDPTPKPPAKGFLERLPFKREDAA